MVMAVLSVVAVPAFGGDGGGLNGGGSGWCGVVCALVLVGWRWSWLAAVAMLAMVVLAAMAVVPFCVEELVAVGGGAMVEAVTVLAVA